MFESQLVPLHFWVFSRPSPESSQHKGGLCDLITFYYFLSCPPLPPQTVILNWIYDIHRYLRENHRYLCEIFCILLLEKEM